MTEFKNNTDDYQFNVEFEALDGDTLFLKEIFIAADFYRSGRPERVWFDTYGGDGDKHPRRTTYGHLNPDDAEAIGMALIMAARVARGEITYDEIKEN